MARRKQSLGEQAARFSLYAPFAVIAIRVLTYGNSGEFDVLISIFVVNSLLIVTGFSLGIFALISMRWYGRKGILVRGVLGTLFNAIVIAAILAILLPVMLTARVKARVAGHWQYRSGAVGGMSRADVQFYPGGKFHISAVVSGKSVSFGGDWEFTDSREIGVTIDEVETGNPATVGQKMLLGTVEEADDHLVLKTETGSEFYDRVP